jgi:HK97 gp10 family phage protein
MDNLGPDYLDDYRLGGASHHDVGLDMARTPGLDQSAIARESVRQFQLLMSVLPEILKAQLRHDIFAQAELLARAMQRPVPVEQGTLRNSIRVEKGREPLSALVKAGGDPTTVHGYDYSLAQEFGTSRNPAQPFFWPTYRANSNRIRRAIKDAALNAIRKKVPLR